MVCSEVEVIAVCWDRLKRLDEAARGRVMRYLLACVFRELASTTE